MSIASEITRIQGAKNTLKTKLNAKNDAQHQIDDEKLDEYGDFVDSIPTGGGGGADLSEYFNSEINKNRLIGMIKKIPDNTIVASTLYGDGRWLFQDAKSLISLPNLDTSNLTSMADMCNGCTSLVTVPVLNTSILQNMSNIFKDCPNLSNNSLNNIMKMCINATSSYILTKTLSAIGLSSAQATTCQGLSNYQDFITAGWTTGY